MGVARLLQLADLPRAGGRAGACAPGQTLGTKHDPGISASEMIRQLPLGLRGWRGGG
jgi:hypothetical protein